MFTFPAVRLTNRSILSLSFHKERENPPDLSCSLSLSLSTCVGASLSSWGIFEGDDWDCELALSLCLWLSHTNLALFSPTRAHFCCLSVSETGNILLNLTLKTLRRHLLIPTTHSLCLSFSQELLQSCPVMSVRWRSKQCCQVPFPACTSTQQASGLLGMSWLV